MTDNAGVRLDPLGVSGLERVHPAALRTLFWEIDSSNDEHVADVRLEKEAWIIATASQIGHCGWNLYTPSDNLGTVLFCPPNHAAGTSRMPTAPVTPGAMLITSLFSEPGLGLAPVLIDAALMHLTRLGYKQVETFAWRESGREQLEFVPERVGLISETEAHSAGFQVVRDHPLLPRLRITLPPDNPLMAAEELRRISADLRC